jgi:hypothetical protein
MPALKNSRRSPRSRPGVRTKIRPSSQSLGFDWIVVTALLAILSGFALWWVSSRGYTLYYGDAEAHLNTARRIFDSRTPGYDQLGSPWLPLPHLLMLPLIGNDSLWRSGLAGAIPSAMCFVIAGMLFYVTGRMVFASRAAALTGLILFALNPNVLYLQSIPMTECAWFASLCGILCCTVWFRRSQLFAAVIAAAFFSLAASLSRYEGWFLIPFVALYFLIAAKKNKLAAMVLFAAIASIGPLYWLAHNLYSSGDPWNFYNGPYSAKAIYERALKAGMGRYPGDHEWRKAFLYYWTAAKLAAGIPLTFIGLAGVIAAVLKRAWWPVALLALPCVFYVLSMYSSGTPIFVPGLWPNSYYNTRYGTVAVILLAFSASALVALCPIRFRTIAAILIVAATMTPWILYPRPDSWVCWKESLVNSEARRAWTHQAADYLKANYHSGEGILTSFGDLTGIFREAGIPLRETLHDGNNPEWLVATTRPKLFLHEEWAVAIAGDSVATAVQRAGLTGPHYRLVQTVVVKDAPVIEIYKRD